MARGLGAYLNPDDELDPANASLMDYMTVDEMGNAKAQAMPQVADPGALAKMYNELSRKTLSDEQAGLSQLGQYITDYQTQARPTDYRALATWAETLRPTGGQLTKLAEQMAPESQDDRTKKFLDLQNLLQQRRGALSQRQLSGLQSMLSQQSAADRLKAQQGAQDARFQQAQELQKQRAEAAQKIAEQKFEQEAKRSEEYLRHNQAMEKIAAEGIKARQEQASANQTRADERQKAGLADKQDQRTESNLIKFESKAIDAVPLVENLNVVEGILGAPLEQFDPKTGTMNGKKIDLPGKSVPGIGRVFLPGSEGERLQTAFSNIFNTTLKERSGAAVTDQELNRLKNEFAQGKFNTEEKMVDALQRYKTILRKRLRQHEAAFSPEVRDRFKTQGGMLADDLLPEAGAGKPPPEPPAVVPGGEKFKAGEAPWELGQ